MIMKMEIWLNSKRQKRKENIFQVPVEWILDGKLYHVLRLWHVNNQCYIPILFNHNQRIRHRRKIYSQENGDAIQFRNDFVDGQKRTQNTQLGTDEIIFWEIDQPIKRPQKSSFNNGTNVYSYFPFSFPICIQIVFSISLTLFLSKCIVCR